MRTAVMLAFAACSRPAPLLPAAAPDPAPVVEALAPAIAYTPVAPAARYGDPVEPTAPDPLLADVFAGLVEATRGRGVLVRDPRLDIAAGELAHLPGATGGAVAFALAAHGVVEPAATTASVSGATADAIAVALAATLGEALFYGNVQIGLGGGGADPAFAIVTYASAIRLDNVPRFTESGFDFAATGPAGFAPHARVTHDDGGVEYLAAQVDGSTLHARFECRAHTGTQWLLVEVGPAHALVPVACKTPPVASYRVEPRANLTAPSPAYRLVALINRERGAAGVPLLALDAHAMIAARAHADRMAHDRSIEHELGGTTPTDRLRAAGIVPALTLETTMAVDTFADAAELLMNDAAYRANALDPRPTRVGVALVPRDGSTYVAIDYVRVPPPTDGAALARRLAADVHARLPLVVATEAMTSAAEWFAQRRALGWSDATIEIAFRGEFPLQELGVTALAVVRGSPDDPPDRLVDAIANPGADIGIAVAQSSRDGFHAGRVWVVMLVGTPLHRRRGGRVEDAPRY